MSPVRKVVVAILSWNGRRHLEVCLPALRAQHDPGVAWEVMVLDNGSSDGTTDWIRRAHPEVRVVASDVNLGFCAGNDRLVEVASDADAVALLNNDTRPRPEWLGELVSALAAAPDDVAAVAGTIVDWEGSRLDFGEGVMTFDGHAFQRDFRRPLADVRLPAPGAELFFACGGNMIVRRDAFRAVGGFAPEYFAYLEDVDLGWRLWSAGHRVVAAPTAVVHHRSAATSDLLGVYNRGFLFERNAWLTAHANYEDGLWQRVMPAVLLTFLARTGAMLVENNPGGAGLAVDPYAGAIATALGATGASSPSAALSTPTPAVSALAPEPPREGLFEKWERFGARELARRGLAKALRHALAIVGPELGGSAALAAAAAAGRPTATSHDVAMLTDPRSVAQLRVLAYLLRHLDAAGRRRAEIQRRRVRSDREIFERFPAWVVPTYPGDVALFGSESFATWLPAELPVRRSTLAELMPF